MYVCVQRLMNVCLPQEVKCSIGVYLNKFMVHQLVLVWTQCTVNSTCIFYNLFCVFSNCVYSKVTVLC